MTEANKLSSLRRLAKRYARANRVSLHQALDLLAGELGFVSWTKLVSTSKKDWIPSPEQMASVEAIVEGALPADFQAGHPAAMAHRLAYLDNAEHGMIGDHPYRLQVALHDVIMVGDGWSITVPENPGARPIVQTVTENDGKCPVFELEFLQKALSLVRDRAGFGAKSPRIGPDGPRNPTSTGLFAARCGGASRTRGSAYIVAERLPVFRSLKTSGTAPGVAHRPSTSSTRPSGVKTRGSLCRQ